MVSAGALVGGVVAAAAVLGGAVVGAVVAGGTVDGADVDVELASASVVATSAVELDDAGAVSSSASPEHPTKTVATRSAHEIEHRCRTT